MKCADLSKDSNTLQHPYESPDSCQSQHWVLSFDTAFKKGAQEYALKSLCETEAYGVVQELAVLSGRDRDVIFQPGLNDST